MKRTWTRLCPTIERTACPQSIHRPDSCRHKWLRPPRGRRRKEHRRLDPVGCSRKVPHTQPSGGKTIKSRTLVTLIRRWPITDTNVRKSMETGQIVCISHCPQASGANPSTSPPSSTASVIKRHHLLNDGRIRC